MDQEVFDDNKIEHISINEIRPNPYQPRKDFNENALEDLAQSIVQHGVMQPIVVRKSIIGYTLVAGERRLKASRMANKTTIPAIIKQITDEEMMVLSIIENLQRENLTAIEEAESYQQLMIALDLTQAEVAEKLGKSRPYVANMLRLLALPSRIQKLITSGKLSSGHGRTLLPLKAEDVMLTVAQKSMRENWSVRTLEHYVNDFVFRTPRKETGTQKPRLIRQYEAQLKDLYGANVDIAVVKKTGRITFEFTSEEEFKRLINELSDRE